MSTQDIEVISNLPVIRERSSVLLMPVMDVNTAMKRLEEFQQFCANYLQESKDGGLDGGDYGTIPGAGQKKVLLKSGADKLAEIYGLYDEYVLLSTVEDWDKGLFDYTFKCILKSRRDDSMVGAGVGSCSSYESKYRWRDAKRSCPQCGLQFIIKGKEQYGGGWLCWKKQGGCGTTFKDGDKAIEGQTVGRIENPDIVDSKNTVLKMAKKRAKIDAIIGVTRSSGIFTQDMEDVPPVAPPKPQPETTTEDIEIGPSSASGTSQSNGGQTRARATSRLSDIPAPAVSPVASAIEYVSQGQAMNFERVFKEACGPGVKALEEAHKWLFENGYSDPATGKPSAKFIPKERFEQVKAAAKAHARTLGKTAPIESVPFYDDDVPF